MTITFDKVKEDEIEDLLLKEDFDGLKKEKNDGTVFIINCSGRNLSSEKKQLWSVVDGEIRNNLVDVEVAVRKCKRVGFFKINNE